MSYAEEEEMWKEQEQRQMTQGAAVGAGRGAMWRDPAHPAAGLLATERMILPQPGHEDVMERQVGFLVMRLPP